MSPPLPPFRPYPTSSDAAASLPETLSARGYAPITEWPWLLHTVVLAWRRNNLVASTRREYRRRRRYGRVRSHLFTFLNYPEMPADNNGSERKLRPMVTYRKVTGGFRSDWGADLSAGVRSVISTAARRGVDAYQTIQQTPRGQAVSYLG